MNINEYVTSDNLTSKEKKERDHFLKFKQNDLSEFISIRPGDDKKAEPDIVVRYKDTNEEYGFEITELWLSKEQAEAFYTNKEFSVNGLTTFDILEPLRERLSDKFQALRKDGYTKYSLPTTLLVIDRTSIPFVGNSNDFFDRFLQQIKEQKNPNILYTVNSALLDGTPINSITIVQQLLEKDNLGSCIIDTAWFIPEENTRVSIAYTKDIRNN